jgi:hypothetical protein
MKRPGDVPQIGALLLGGAANGADGSYGSRLTGVLADAGLAKVTAELHAPIVSGGTLTRSEGGCSALG